MGLIYLSDLCTINLHPAGIHGATSIKQLACIFTALSQSFSELKAYWEEISTSHAKHPLSHIFPNPTPVPGGSIRATGFKSPQSVKGKVKAIVKFTKHYSEDMHNILAAEGYAPKLYYCARVVGGVYMIVMEYVEGESIWEKSFAKKAILDAVLEEVEAVLHILHGKGFVFVICGTRMLYVFLGLQIRLSLLTSIGPERHGKAGETRYPIMINLKNGWADSVNPNGFIHKDHNLWQLNHLKSLCK
ncbi:hypothetical protein D9611_007947 [Ephemerocybe angulata]|uniref:Protein kinase domain-containing protein n=1 Tax=Ephemerocybe angulata TaxID=980116 RepID=A0A8H5FKV2_9AGAR|nr:hypothetical protein D9611_007947 [Tulosesus angulatus]